MTSFVLVVLALGIGVFGGYLVRRQVGKMRIDSAEVKAESLINEAKNKQKDLLLRAKDKALAIIEDAKKEEQSRRQELQHIQRRLESREALFDKKLLDLESKQQKLYEKAEEIRKVKEQVTNILKEQEKKLNEIAQMTKEDAQQILFDRTEKAIKENLLERIVKLEKENSLALENKAKEVLSLVIQRCASSHAAETTTTIVDLPSDEMKGRIIGREGRNIKAIEQITGVEIIVDDTPQAITISGFSPIRRQVAKKALEKLILDGRIHPAKIEGAIEDAKKDLAVEITKAGEAALYEVGIAGFDNKLVQILGRLKYRTSYGQNVLKHSIEVAQLAALLAEELGADVPTAKKSGLLHDIGKAVDHEVQGTHPEIGREIAKKFNLPEKIINGIAYHHEDKPPTLEAVIVKVADAISGARVGARKDTYENYLQRLEELEKIALDFEGVEKSYAIQAGREVRVFVIPDVIDDLAAHKLAKNIACKIEQELKYPGEIRVNVIREMRVTEFAR